MAYAGKSVSAEIVLINADTVKHVVWCYSIGQPKIRTARGNVVISRTDDRNRGVIIKIPKHRQQITIHVDTCNSIPAANPKTTAVGVVAAVGYLQIRFFRHRNDVSHALVVEVELEHAVGAVASVEVASVKSKVVNGIIHVGQTEAFNERSVLVVLPELAKLGERAGIIVLAVEHNARLKVARRRQTR